MRSLLIPALLVLVLGLALVACNKDNSQQQGATSTAGTPSSTASQPPAAVTPDGSALYAKGNCAMCHGEDLAGKPMGPALQQLSQNWDAAKLTAYLTDPQGYTATDSRLQENSGKYSMKMPAAPLSPEETAALAEWLLSQ